jgi:hypothetical protein
MVSNSCLEPVGYLFYCRSSIIIRNLIDILCPIINFSILFVQITLQLSDINKQTLQHQGSILEELEDADKNEE